MDKPNPRSAIVPEYRFAKNVSLPLAVPATGDLAEFLPPDSEPSEANDTYDWGRVERIGSTIKVFPEKAGEFDFVVSANDKKGLRHSVLCHLGVNGDPKRKRKDIPPPLDAPFPKENCQTLALEGGRFVRKFPLRRTLRIVGASRRGIRHAEDGKFRDDHMGALFNERRKCVFLAVADGGGSYRFSREGSRIAVVSSLSFLNEEASRKNWKSIFQDGKILVRAARKAVEDIVKTVKTGSFPGVPVETPPKLEDFNTTLLLAAVRWLADGQLIIRTFSVGDGVIAWKSGTRSELLCRPDFGQGASETLFVTNREVWSAASTDWNQFSKRSMAIKVDSREAMNGELLLMSDGISDPFFWGAKSVQNKENWNEFFSTMSFKNGADNAAGSMEEESNRLLDSLSVYIRQGGDDRTLLMMRPVGPGSEEVFHA